MRIKITTFPPLVKLNSWYTINDSLKPTAYKIQDLLEDMASYFSLSSQIFIKLDDFDIQSKCLVFEVLRENDLLCVYEVSFSNTKTMANCLRAPISNHLVLPHMINTVDEKADQKINSNIPKTNTKALNSTPPNLCNGTITSTENSSSNLLNKQKPSNNSTVSEKRKAQELGSFNEDQNVDKSLDNVPISKSTKIEEDSFGERFNKLKTLFNIYKIDNKKKSFDMQDAITKPKKHIVFTDHGQEIDYTTKDATKKVDNCTKEVSSDIKAGFSEPTNIKNLGSGYDENKVAFTTVDVCAPNYQRPSKPKLHKSKPQIKTTEESNKIQIHSITIPIEIGNWAPRAGQVILYKRYKLGTDGPYLSDYHSAKVLHYTQEQVELSRCLIKPSIQVEVDDFGIEDLEEFGDVTNTALEINKYWIQKEELVELRLYI